MTSDLSEGMDTDAVPVGEVQDINQELEPTGEHANVPPAGSAEEHPSEEDKEEQVKSSAKLEGQADPQALAEEECRPPGEEVKDFPQPSSVPEPDYHFECICGETGLLDYKVSFLDCSLILKNDSQREFEDVFCMQILLQCCRSNFDLSFIWSICSPTRQYVISFHYFRNDQVYLF